jgi:hypothetical protein
MALASIWVTLPVGIAVLRRHHPAHAVDAALGIGEGAVLFQEGRARQEHMRVVGGLVEEEIVHDHAFHRREARRDVLGVRIGLQDVLALDVDALERAVDGGVEHVRDAQARLGVELDAPQALEDVAHFRQLDVPVARQFVRERAHVAGTLHVVLAAERVHADARTADIAGQPWRGWRSPSPWSNPGSARSRRGRNRSRHCRPGIETRRAADFLRRHAGEGFGRFRRMALGRKRRRPNPGTQTSRNARG